MDQIADVVVVGAGISGALMALRLAARGRDVLVLDRRAPVLGSTLASTAMIQFEIDTPLHRLADQIGMRAASAAWQRSRRAVSQLGALVRREGIVCGWDVRRSLYVAGDAFGHRAMRAEATARARAGVPGTLLDGRTLQRHFGINRTAAIVSPGSAAANPAQLTAGVLRRAQWRGVRICRAATVGDAVALRHGVELHVTARDESHDTPLCVYANAVVFCTGYEVPTVIPSRTHAIRSTWAIAAAVSGGAPEWLRNTVVWEGSDPYSYLRLAGRNTLIAGGRDEEAASRYADANLLDRKARGILADVANLLPTIHSRPTHVWGGAFGESPTGLPLIDRLPGHRNAWVVAGFGGNGITYSMIAADIVEPALRGVRDPDLHLYRLR